MKNSTITNYCPVIVFLTESKKTDCILQIDEVVLREDLSPEDCANILTNIISAALERNNDNVR